VNLIQVKFHLSMSLIKSGALPVFAYDVFHVFFGLFSISNVHTHIDEKREGETLVKTSN